MIWRTRSDRLYSGAVRGMTGQVRSRGQVRQSLFRGSEGEDRSCQVRRSGQVRQSLFRGSEGDVMSGQEFMTCQEIRNLIGVR